LSNGKLISLFSGNGSYIHINPRFGYPKNDLSLEEKVIGFETLVKGFNNYLFKIESEFYDKYPQYRNFVELDKINNRNRQIKAPLSIHKSFDYIVYPIPESFEIPLIKYHEINDKEIIKARKLLNKFKNNEPGTDEIKQFNRTLEPYLNEAKTEIKDKKNYKGIRPQSPENAHTIDLIKSEPILNAIFSSDEWKDGNIRRITLMSSYMGASGWDLSDVQKWVEAHVSEWEGIPEDLHRRIEFGYQMGPPGIDTLYKRYNGFPSMGLGDLLQYLPEKPTGYLNPMTFINTKYSDEIAREKLDKALAEKDNDADNLKIKILTKILKHTEPRSKEIADLINSKFDFYINHQTQIYYERLEDGSFKQIDYIRIIDFCNESFGANQISDKTCKNVLSYITKPVNKNYNLLEFTNGLLNTKTKEFTSDKTELEELPKLKLPFKWNQEAKGTYIKKVFEEILDYEKNPTNMELWLRIVGHMFMAWNSIEKIMIVVGPSRSGKSTLTTALERIFNISRVPTQKIVKNERFALIDLIDKDLNIDDDINNGSLKGIGFLNTLISGKTIPVEKKGLNEPIILGNQQIPRLIANGNSLPPVIGEGFGTRLILIKAPNKRPIDKRDETLHSKIQQGEYDNELEWLVYTAINIFWDNINKPLITQEFEDQQNREYQFQSYPLLVAIESLFKKDWDNRNTIPVKDVNKYLLMWSEWAYQNGKISKEHRRPSNTQIKRAMDKAGFHSKTENYKEDDSYTSHRVYVDIEEKIYESKEDDKQTTLVKFIIKQLEEVSE
jgi:phage/plasmid-associated DNA primase